MHRHTGSFIVGMIAVAVCTGRSAAVMYGFTNISANNVADAAAGEAQLAVDVTDPGSNQVKFTFTNTGAEAMSITDTYWDDDGASLSGIASIVNGTGVSFSAGASPPNLPSGTNLGFSADFDADSNAPTQPNGVNPGETLSVTFNLLGGVTFNDVIADINSALLRIGIHVQGFAGGGSEAFVNANPVPAPGAALLGLMGLAAIAALRKFTGRTA